MAKEAKKMDVEALFENEEALKEAQEGDFDYEVATRLRNQEKYVEAAKFYEKSAKNGSAESAFRLAFLNLEGKVSGMVDMPETKHWFEIAGQLGDKVALYNLGHMYENGDLGEVDRARAFSYYKQSAEMGYSPAQVKMGIFSQYGVLDDEPKIEEAIVWYKKAARADDRQAQESLGNLYVDTNYSGCDFFEARLWYLLAAENGSVTAPMDLGLMYQQGEGLEEDLEKAVHWYQVALDRGNKRAYGKLVMGKLNLDDGQENIDKARDLLLEGLKAGADDCLTHLAWFYLEVDPDLDKAYDYCVQAIAKEGGEVAQNLLKEIVNRKTRERDAQ